MAQRAINPVHKLARELNNSTHQNPVEMTDTLPETHITWTLAVPSPESAKKTLINCTSTTQTNPPATPY